MSTTDYHLYFVIGRSLERPYNSLELRPAIVGKGLHANKDLPVQTMTARQIYEYWA